MSSTENLRELVAGLSCLFHKYPIDSNKQDGRENNRFYILVANQFHSRYILMLMKLHERILLGQCFVSRQ